MILEVLQDAQVHGPNGQVVVSGIDAIRYISDSGMAVVVPLPHESRGDPVYDALALHALADGINNKLSGNGGP